MLSQLFSFFAFLSAAFGAVQLLNVKSPSAFTDSVFWLVLAIPLFWVALRLRPTEDEPEPVIIRDEPPLRWIHYAAIAAGSVLMLVVAESNGDLLKRHLFLFHENLQFTLFCLSMLLVAWGFSGGWKLKPVHEWDSLELVAITTLTLLALWLRLTNGNDLIPLHIDTVNFIGTIPVFDWGGNEPVYLFQRINTIATFPRVYAYWQWLSTSFFGRDLAALALPTSLLGTLAIPGIYMLGKYLLNRRVAFIAAGLLATMPLHLHFSRIVHNVGDPTAAIFTFMFLMRGLRYGGRANFALAGIALGWTQLFHEAGRVVFPVILTIWWGFVLINAGQKERQVLLRRIGTTIFCALIVTLPFFYTLYATGSPFLGHAGQVIKPDQFNVNGIMGRFTHNIEMLLFQSHEKIFFLGSAPHLMNFITLFSTLGIAYLFWRWRKPASILIALWIVIPLISITLLLDELQSQRVQPFVPALILLAAVGVDQITRTIKSPQLQRLALMWGVTSLCIIQTITYFISYAPQYVQQVLNKEPWHMVVLQLDSLPPNSVLHIVGTNRLPIDYIEDVINFETNGKVPFYGYTPEQVTDFSLVTLDRTKNHVFFIQQPDNFTPTLLRRYFPDVINGDFVFDSVPHWYFEYVVPSG